FNTDDNAADGESVIALHHYKLKMRPQYIDNLLNVTREKARFMERQDSDLDIKALTTKDFEDKWDEYLYNSFYAKVGDELHEPLYGSKNSRTINLTAHLYKKKILTPEKTLLEKNYKLAIKCILNTNTAFSMYSSYLGSYTRAVADDYMLWLDKYKQLMDDVYIREANSISDVVEEFDNWEKGFAPYSKGDLPPKKGFFNRIHRIFKAGKELYNENIRSGVRTSKEATKQKEISLAEKKSQAEITKLEQSKAERSEKVFARNTKRANNWAHKVFQSGAFRKMIIGLNIYNSTVATKSLANNANPRNLFNLAGSYVSLASITVRYLQENTDLMTKVAEEAVLADPIARYASRGSTFVQRAWRQPVYTKLGWAGSAFMIVVSSMDTYDRFSKNDNDAAAAYAIATIAGIGSLSVSVYLATASAAIGWIPYVGWACLAIGFVATGIAVWLTDTPLEAYLVNSVFGTHKEIDDIADWTPDNVKYELYTQRADYANAGSIEMVDMEDMEDMFAWLHDMLTNFKFDICKDSKPSLNDKNVKLGRDDLKYCYGFNVGFEFNSVLPGKSKLHYHLQIYPYGIDDESAMFETIEYKIPEIDNNENNGEQEENSPDNYSYNNLVNPIQVYKTLFVYDERKGCYTGDISFSFGNKLFELDDKGKKKEPLFSKEMIAVFYCRLAIDEENSLYWPYQGDDDNIYAASFALLTCKKSQSGSTRFNQELIRSNARIGTLAMILDEAKKFQDSHVNKIYSK
ncbi:MAG: hypothetical protein LBV43_08200, partial [Prevotella sp.]|nr:hypothetical protein [Prevotella sp.]